VLTLLPTEGNVPVETMHLKQLFWSLLGQSTYFAFGLCCLRVRSTSIMAIPVATGISTHRLPAETPALTQGWGEVGAVKCLMEEMHLDQWVLDYLS